MNLNNVNKVINNPVDRNNLIQKNIQFLVEPATNINENIAS